ncbi:hypothetical protein [Arthrobacter mobilis]|uniref:MFS transporter n=1 Tax=Arthrobacter mobilis TaxID=2724944 RepID=A0A7X6QM47_9MICC|nr:hypothetical protein [Arthrobacter mobilis]NKX56417.1 hypothetical protein [Arthrobacter mobilis]
MGTGPRWRLLRSAAVAAAALSLSAAAHVAGGGTLPEPGILAALAALILLPATVLAGRKLGPASLAGMLGAGQLALHEAFAALGVSGHCMPEGPAAAIHAGHTFPGAVASLDCAAAGSVAHAAGGPDMAAAHVLATVLTGLMLLKGEDALWALAAWLRPLAALPAAVVLPPAVRPARPPEAPLLVRPLFHYRLDPLRGPPAPAFR